MKDQIRDKAQEIGFDLVGFCNANTPETSHVYRAWLDKGHHATMDYLAEHAELKEDPKNLLEGAQSIIAVGMNYHQPNEAVQGQPHIASYALGRDYHKVLRGNLRELGRWIEETFPGSKWRACVDSAPILEREYANRAGLGWYGKNTCLIDSIKGSWFVVGMLLTTLEIKPDNRSVGGCGTCTACIDACPTNAIVQKEENWQIDSRKCISYLTIEHKGDIDPELQKGIGDWTFGCDICQTVCPFNSQRATQPDRAKKTQTKDFLATRKWPSLQELSVIQEDEWDELTRGSPVRRAGLEGIRRNAKINLANAKTP